MRRRDLERVAEAVACRPPHALRARVGERDGRGDGGGGGGFRLGARVGVGVLLLRCCWRRSRCGRSWRLFVRLGHWLQWLSCCGCSCGRASICTTVTAAATAAAAALLEQRDRAHQLPQRRAEQRRPLAARLERGHRLVVEHEAREQARHVEVDARGARAALVVVAEQPQHAQHAARADERLARGVVALHEGGDGARGRLAARGDAGGVLAVLGVFTVEEGWGGGV